VKYNFPNSNDCYAKIAPQEKTANLNEFGILFLLGLNFQSPTQTRRLTSDFSRNSRAYRIFFLPINRPLSLKKRGEARNQIYFLLFSLVSL
jgi:hypothetical protein